MTFISHDTKISLVYEEKNAFMHEYYHSTTVKYSESAPKWVLPIWPPRPTSGSLTYIELDCGSWIKSSELYIDWNDNWGLDLEANMGAAMQVAPVPFCKMASKKIQWKPINFVTFTPFDASFLFSEHARTIELSTQVLTKNKYCSTTEIFHEQNEVRSKSRAKIFGLSEFSVFPWRVLRCYTVIYLVTS